MSDSLQLHGLQHPRPPCLSPIPGVYSNSWAFSWWSHPTISSSVIPFSSCLSQHQGLFQWVGSLCKVAKEGWVPKNWCFWTVVLEKILESPLGYRRSIQSILSEIRPEYSLEGLMLKLKLQYFHHLMWKPDSLEKTLILGNIEGKRRRGWQRMRWLDGLTDSRDMGLGRLRQLVMDREVWRATVHAVAKSWTWLSDWTELKIGKI